MKVWLNYHAVPSKQQYPHFFSQIALESISEHVTIKMFWGSAPRPGDILLRALVINPDNQFIQYPPLSNPGYAPVGCLYFLKFTERACN